VGSKEKNFESLAKRHESRFRREISFPQAEARYLKKLVRGLEPPVARRNSPVLMLCYEGASAVRLLVVPLDFVEKRP